MTNSEFGNGYPGNNFFADYKFNSGEGDILYDHSGNQNHGTIVGATWEEIEEETVLGCTDPLATNYDINANSDDGTCSYPDNGNFSLSFDAVDDYVDLGPNMDSDDEFSIRFDLGLYR